MRPPPSQLWTVHCLALLVVLSLYHSVTLSSATAETQSDQTPALRKQLRDPAPDVRRRAAMTLAAANDVEAVPVLIDLLAELPADKRRPIEDFLSQLAGEWAPVVQFASEDDIGRRIRRDCWAAWWRHTNGAALLGLLRQHTLTADKQAKVRSLIARLGDGEYAAREEASQELFDLGRLTLPMLRTAVKDHDPEIARRAKLLIERIEREPAHLLPIAAVRLLAWRKPAGGVEALLAYLPHAEDETRAEEVGVSLATLALRDGKPDPALLHALSDEQPLRRATAAQALAKGGGAEGRSAVRKLLKDAVPAVRLRAALALASAGEREGVPVLIDLLAELPIDQTGEAEAALYQLAGDSAPEVSLGTEPAQRRKCRDAWAAWWKLNAGRVDLARLDGERSLLGFTIVCDLIGNRVYEIDRHGKQRWAIHNLTGPVDAWMLPGNRVLIAEFYAQRVTERDLQGNVLWQKQVGGHPINVQRLPNGSTFIATANGAILEVDRAGKETSINPMPGQILGAYRSRKGVIVSITQNGQCLLMDASGKQLKSFASGNAPGHSGRLDLLTNGRILIAQCQRNKVVEFDGEGKKLLEVDAPGLTTATGLPNGHILVAAQNNQRVYEVDRAGKVVWEHKGAGQVFRARRR